MGNDRLRIDNGETTENGQFVFEFRFECSQINGSRNNVTRFGAISVVVKYLIDGNCTVSVCFGLGAE